MTLLIKEQYILSTLNFGAIDSEWKSILGNDTWNLEGLHNDSKSVGRKWDVRRTKSWWTIDTFKPELVV